VPDDPRRSVEYYRIDPNAPKMDAQPGLLEQLFRVFGSDPIGGMLPGPMVVSTPVKLARQALLSKLLNIPIPETPWAKDAVGVLAENASIRPGLARAVEDASPLSPREYAQQALINARNNSYHATDLEGLKGIFRSGQIEPGNVQWAPGDVQGVSVSRVPRVASKSEKAITLVLDNEKMPLTRPFAEEGYEKIISETKGPLKAWYDYIQPEEMKQYNELSEKLNELNWDIATTLPPDASSVTARDSLREATKAIQLKGETLRQEAIKANTVVRRNPRFEFENRTYNKPIPIEAVKKVLVDKSALPDPGFGTKADPWRQLKDFEEVTPGNFSIEILPSGRAMHSSPAAEIYNSPLLDMLERITGRTRASGASK
jgi:hypothetical protein